MRSAGSGALKGRDFRLLFTGQAASWLGDAMIPVAIAFAVLDLTGSPRDLGVVLAAREIPLVVLLLIGGVLGDRRSRRRIMVAADATRAASQACAAVLLISGHIEIWQLTVLQALNGAATAVFNPASTALIPSVVTSDALQSANALRGMAISGSSVVGPAISGVVVAASGPGAAFAIDAATFLISAAMLARIRVPATGPDPHATSFLADLRAGWREFASRDWVVAFVAASALINVFNAAFTVLGPVVARRELGGAAAWGLIAACLGGGAVAGGLVALRVRIERPLVVASLALTLFAVPLALLALAVAAPVVAAGAILGGVALITSNALWETTLQRRVPQQALARVSAYDWLGSLALLPLGYICVGPVAVGLGVESTLYLAAAGIVATALAPLAVAGVRGMQA